MDVAAGLIFGVYLHVHRGSILRIGMIIPTDLYVVSVDGLRTPIQSCCSVDDLLRPGRERTEVESPTI